MAILLKGSDAVLVERRNIDNSLRYGSTLTRLRGKNDEEKQGVGKKFEMHVGDWNAR